MEFNIISTTQHSNFEYRDVIAVNGSFDKNVDTDLVTSIHGDCYRLNEQGQIAQMIGYFNASRNSEGEYIPDLGPMPRADGELVYDAFDAIIAQIIPVDE